MPCYNEQEGLRLILRQDLSWLDEIIVVDNNSVDNTAFIAKQFGCVVVKEKKQGYGAAYQAGFSQASGDVIVAIDSDGTYPIESARFLTEKMIRENVDFISGNRFAFGKPKNMPLLNYLGNYFFTVLARSLFIKNISDSWSGMWIFKREILNKINLREEGMAFSQEIKIKTVASNFKLIEIPIAYRARAGKVKLKRFKDGFYTLLFLLGIELRSSLIWREKKQSK